MLDFEQIAHELYRVTKDGGVVVWVVHDSTIGGSESCTSFHQAIYFKETVGFNLHDTMIYAKKNPVPLPGTRRYQPQFEYMFVFSKGQPATWNIMSEPCKRAGATQPRTKSKMFGDNGYCMKDGLGAVKETKPRTNIWYYGVGGRGTGTHNAPFPEKLAEDHILSWSNPGDLVLDPMCGSGTTLKMAKMNGRGFIGMDISDDYCAIARERVNSVPRKLKFKMPGENDV